MSEKLLAWFGKRRQSRAVRLMQSHLALTTGTVDELEKAIEHKIHGDEKEAQNSITRLSKMEEEADGLRRDIAMELTKGEVPPTERDDLLHLSRRLDMVTDWARGAARVLSIIQLSEMPKGLLATCTDMIKSTRECAWALRRCVDKLGESPSEALELADLVERLEEKIDEQYQEARRQLPLLDFSKVNVGEAILLSEFLDALEQIADWCENTIDQVRIVAVRLF